MSKMNRSKEMDLKEAAERLKGLIKRYGIKINYDLVVNIYAVPHHRGGTAPHFRATGSWNELARADSVITLHCPPDKDPGPVKMEIIKDRDRWGEVQTIAPLRFDPSIPFVPPEKKD